MDIAFRYRNYFRKVSICVVVERLEAKPCVQDIIVDLLVYRRWYVPPYPVLRACTDWDRV